MKIETVDVRDADLSVVNAARVSFNKQVDEVSSKDVRLIKYLAEHNHFTPFTHHRITFRSSDQRSLIYLHKLKPEHMMGLVFTDEGREVRHSLYGWWKMLNEGVIVRHHRWSVDCLLYGISPISSQYLSGDVREGEEGTCYRSDYRMPAPNDDFVDFTLRETVPIFVARQRFKHMVGFTYNEVSRRYVDEEPTLYLPTWRYRADNAKQGSGGDLPGDEQQRTWHEVDRASSAALNCYHNMLHDNVAPEQARGVLPQSMYTSYIVTGSLSAWRRAYGLRSDPHAQKEIRDLADMWKKELKL